MKKTIISLFFIFSIVTLLHSSCDKITDCKNGLRNDFLFELPVSISPVKDTFNVGDTIWIENTFSHDLYNLHHNKNYTLQDFNFKSKLSITNLNTPKPAISYENPNIITVIGTTILNNVVSNKYQVIHIDYLYEAGQYQYKAAFIVDKPGSYLINFFSDAENDEISITECKNENLDINYKVNNNDDNNYEMIKYAKDNYYSDWSIEEFNNTGGYCFHVK